ncbi:MAG: cytidylate kinase-like family protein [Lachnospiraceae bacterium]|nr:cytidylate kinase-like family protein [Lachnospiraceae bacterium]
MIITIGRQFGSGGREIGKALAIELGITYYDKELLLLAAQKSGLDQAFLESRDESEKSNLLYSLIMGGTFAAQGCYSVGYMAKQAQYNAVQSVAQKGDCVIVGRCADYILRDYNNLVRVFITAEENDRVEHISKRDRIDSKEARKRMLRTDKERSLYYNCNTDQQWGNAASYDLCINTSMLGVNGTVRLIKSYISEKDK